MSEPGLIWKELLRRRYQVLLCTLLLTLIVPPLISAIGWNGRFLEFLLIVNLAASAFGADSRKDRTRLLFFVVAAGALRLAGYLLHVDSASVASTIGWIVLAIVAAIRALRFALRGLRINSEHICAALSVYLLLAQFYGFGYWQIEAAWPGSFRAHGLPVAASQFDLASATYLSFVTIATLGFGDLTPHSQVARGFVVTEAVLGQFYMAVLLARLVGAYASRED